MPKIKKKNLLIILSIIAFLVVSALVYYIGKTLNNKPIIVQNKIIKAEDIYNYTLDFESTKYLGPSSKLSKNNSLSGESSGIADTYQSFSPAAIIPIPTNDSTKLSDVNIKFWVSPSSTVINATLIFSIIDQNQNQIHWEGYNIGGDNYHKDNWYSFQNNFSFPKQLTSTSNSLKVYLWNLDKDGNTIYIDDLSISFDENYIPEKARSKFIDFEKHDNNAISSKYSKSGFYSTYAKGKDAFSTSIIIPMSEIKYNNLESIAYSFHYLCEKPQIDAAFVVFVCDSLGNDVYWNSTHLSFENHPTKVWEIGNGNVFIPKEALISSNNIKIYLWNRNDNTIYMDDVYIVIKEKDNSKEIQTQQAFDFLSEKKFEKKINHPPYDFKYANLIQTDNKNIAELNKTFTRATKVIVGRFNKNKKKDMILAFYNGNQTLISFNEIGIISENVKFKPELPLNFNAFTDQETVFISDLNKNIVLHYEYNLNSKTFELITQVNIDNTRAIAGICTNNDKTISIFSNNGNVSTYQQNQNEYKLLSTKNLLKIELGNLKFFKGNFLDNNQQVLLFFIQNKQDKYQLFEYQNSTQSWILSPLHSNKSSQSFDKLEFLNDYYVFNYDNKSPIKLLEFSKTKKFELKLLSFNKMSYEILYNIDFKGYPNKQNPKYYEISKIITGDFIGDKKTEIIVFQDNLEKIEWLTQKVEIYSFE
ncbi:MAG: hypothetical protein PHP52_03400 [Bacteroidales bacterium]|nr:hypothetical protein [Bacteroidales bacterium]MDD4218132.1 hypothetical protein [Bacteroidales bacterium]MDY0142868.1 hypothetical protein [Bacteroidales bacterium]